MPYHQQQLYIMSNEPLDPPTDMTRTFSNPICKDTYNSLPRIYGKKKHNARTLKSPTHNRSEAEQSTSQVNNHYHSANEATSASKIKKRRVIRESSVKLSQPKLSTNCSKQKCSCKNHELSETKVKLHPVRKVLLPEIRRFELEDLQSQHKVSMTGFSHSRTNSSSGLQKIIEQQDQMRSTQLNGNKNNRASTTYHPSRAHEEQPIRNRKTVKEMKKKQRFKAMFNSKFDIEEESEEEKNTDELKQNQFRDPSARYKTDPNDSESPKSGASLSLSSFIFKGVKRQNTNFHLLNQTQKSFEKELSRKNSMLSNGLFRIPEEAEYSEYLRSHRPMDPNFKAKNLLKKQTFRIVRSDDEVYFGEVDEKEMKHGLGLNVSEKEIFEGEYKMNVKVQGFERNIDGIYEGGFLNGLRSGKGTFRWNNGQVFQGNWENGMKNGFGTWRSPKGSTYEGQWKSNRQEGQGVFKHRVSTYTGEFKNFLKHGYGEEKFANGDLYQGEYKQGKPDGKGRYEWHDGGWYEGQFVRGMREGKGRWTDSNGTCYEGLFKRDFKHGYGKEVYASGQKFEGEFVEGSRRRGRLVDKNGTTIEVDDK